MCKFSELVLCKMVLERVILAFKDFCYSYSVVDMINGKLWSDSFPVVYLRAWRLCAVHVNVVCLFLQ